MKGDGGKNQKNSSTKSQANDSRRGGLADYAFAMEIEGEEFFVPGVNLEENPDSPRAIINSPSLSPRNSPVYFSCSTPSNLANLKRPPKGSDR